MISFPDAQDECIYILVGTSPDLQVWNVMAFFSKEKAKKKAEEYNIKAQEITSVKVDIIEKASVVPPPVKCVKHFDPDFVPGSVYEVESVEMADVSVVISSGSSGNSIIINTVI